MGFLKRDGDFVPFISEGSITSQTVIACFDYFAERLRRKTVVVIDRASIHTSQDFEKCLQRWRQQGLHVYYLPSYSPELNLTQGISGAGSSTIGCP